MSIYTGGFSQTISSNTLRNSHSQYSFPKAGRFGKIRVDNNAKYQELPQMFETRTTGFGYGGKNGVILRCGLDSPPPNNYKIKG
jgi:hypothetical protein